MDTLSFRSASDDFATTTIENIFINEYMPEADGDYVKIYLYGLKNSQNPNIKPLSNAGVAELLNIPEEKIFEAYRYWESKGLVRLDGTNGKFTVFFNCVSSIAAKDVKLRTSKNCFPAHYKDDEKFNNLIIKTESMLGGQILPARFIESIVKWIEDYKFDYECVCFLLEYCLTYINNSEDYFNLNGKINYLNKVAETWYEHEIRTMPDAIFYTEEFNANNKLLYNILNKLGIRRKPLPYEHDLLNKWINTFHFNHAIIMEGVNRTTVPNLNYLDKILTDWNKNNYKTVEEVRRAQKQRRVKKATKNSTRNPQASDDRIKAVQEFEDKLFETFKRKPSVNI